MSTNQAKMKILSIYKAILRESQKIPSYNYRNYALRRVRDSFKEHRNLTDSNLIEKQVEFANKNLQMIRRQAIVGHLYSTDKLVIEK